MQKQKMIDKRKNKKTNLNTITKIDAIKKIYHN
jgi:hypothetical protein